MVGNQTLEELEKNFQSFRFALLRHQVFAGSIRASHWDLLLEKPNRGEERLLTFEIGSPPEEWTIPIVVRQLPDHRRLYLEFEGPISNDRGTVTRVLEGTIQWRIATQDVLEIAVQPTSSLANGVLRMTRNKNPFRGNGSLWEMTAEGWTQFLTCD